VSRAVDGASRRSNLIDVGAEWIALDAVGEMRSDCDGMV